MKNGKIDFVITWVDGNDKEWQEEKSKYQQTDGDDNRVVRYRDFDNLKYWFRAAEKYASWVNKIYFVTWGHVPEWLNTEYSKIKVVNHKDFIPEEYLPTFSSHTIELNLHRIKGLSEKFVYFNDDIFINDFVKPTDFFKNDLPCDDCVETALLPMGDTPQFANITANDIFYINKNFNKRSVLCKNIFKYINLKYGINNLRTICLLPFPKYSLFKNSHICNAYLKSTFNEVWQKEYEVLNNTCLHKFRNSDDVNQYIFRYWQFVTGKFMPRSTRFGKGFELNNNGNGGVISAIGHSKLKCICINDSDTNLNFDEVKSIINNELELKYPEKSKFEK